MRDDHDWFLSLTWTRDDSLLGTSRVVLSWETAEAGGVEPGTYRMVYNGDSKSLFGEITGFSGTSGNFTLV